MKEGGKVARALLLALLFPFASAASGAPAVLLKSPSPAELVELGMPLSARKELLSLPPAERGKFRLLPRLLRRLAAAGHEREALALFAEVAPHLAEPVRSEAFLAAGEIHWDRKEYREAERAFREVSAKSQAGPEAAYRLGRILLAGGKTGEAAQAFASSPPGARTALAKGDVEMARGNVAGALAAWKVPADGSPAAFEAAIRALSGDPDRAAASRNLRAAARSAPAGTPEQSFAFEALARAFLDAGYWRAALEAAREALSGAPPWRDAARNLPEWDGAAARESWRAMVALFPYKADTERFYAKGERFLALADRDDALGSAENGVRRVALRVRGAGDALALLHDNTAAGIRRAEEVRNLFLRKERQAAGMRGRLRSAADSIVLSGLGKSVEPAQGALLDRIGEVQDNLRERLSRLGTAFRAKSVNDWSPPLVPEDRVMVLFAQIRLSRLEDSLRVLEGKSALLRGKVWNRWKAGYAARATRLLDRSERAAAAARKGAEDAESALAPLRDAFERQKPWPAYLRWMDGRLAGHLALLSGRRAQVRTAASTAFRDARGTLAAAIERNEHRMRYLAARAATEWLIQGKGSPLDNVVLERDRREALLREAIAHWEASLPPGGEQSPIAAEALYALAELRLEEAEARFFGQEEDPGRRRDYSLPISLFRRVAEEHPDSPYAEPALYGLAVSSQDAGFTDDSVQAMERLLARYPGTRYSDEILVRLGEHAFDLSDYRRAEDRYRRVRETASPDLLTTARFKLGWSLFLQERPGEAVDPFLSALLLSPQARKTGGMQEESARMLARSLVDAGMHAETEEVLSRRGAAAHGPAVLLHVQSFLETQNRYPEAAGVADRFARTYPFAAERLAAEIAAAESLRKGDRIAESHARRRRFHEIFGPGTRWQATPGRTAGDIARANMVAEDGLRTAAFFFHAKARTDAQADRGAVLASYDTYLSLFPTASNRDEVAYQRAWILFEAGRKREALRAFEEIARKPAGARGEPSWYMAVQSAKDVAQKSDPLSQTEVVRLAKEYEGAFPKGERISQILIDRARALFNLREFPGAADAALRASLLLPAGPERRKAKRLEGDARFEASDYAGAEAAFREILAESPEEKERGEVEKWVAFSLFRRAEELPPADAAEAAALFARTAGEFPAQEIAQTALFRAGTASAQAGRTGQAIEAFLAVERAGKDKSLAVDSTRWLARLYEKTGNKAAAAERYERLGAAEGPGPEKGKLLLRAAELFSGIDEGRARRNFAAVASLPETPPALKVSSLFRAAESARAEGKTEEADRYYAETVNAQRSAPEVSPEIAGRALFERAEFRFARYRSLAIAPPLEKTYAAKQAALEASATLYVDAIRSGDAETVSASLHRIGEGFEDFRSAILSSPPPRGLSEREREEYVFLLEERAAPIEEKAVDAYLKNLRQAVSGDHYSSWVEKSLKRLFSLRPARFAKKGEYAFPVVTVPEFVGVIERGKR